MNDEHPEWLPDLVCIDDHGGDWDLYCAFLYVCFIRDFIETTPGFFRSMEFRLKREPYRLGREATFWHIISKEKQNDVPEENWHSEDEREENLPRCERICWPRPIIDEHHDRNLLVWEQMRHGERRWAVALHDFQYVVIIAEREGYYLLWTAFPPIQPHWRRKLRREYERYLEESPR